MVICQLFRSRLNQHLLRLNGEFPAESEEVITSCECQKLLHRMMLIHSPASLPVSYTMGRFSFTTKVPLPLGRELTPEGQSFCIALRDHDLVPGQPYEIVRQGDGSLAVRCNPAANN